MYDTSVLQVWKFGEINWKSGTTLYIMWLVEKDLKKK